MRAEIDPQHPFIQVVTSGGSGCRFYRSSMPAFTLNWFENLGVHCIEVPSPLMEPGILGATRSVVLKSPQGFMALELVKQLYAAKQKFPALNIVADFDDIVYHVDPKEGDFDFSPFGPQDPIALEKRKEQDAYTIEMLKLLDRVIVTNDYSKRQLEKLGLTNIVVLPNAVPRSMWNTPRRKPLDKDLVKPRVVLTQCPQHYRPGGRAPDGKEIPEELGDLKSAEWREWLIKNVKDDKISLVQLGGPSFAWNAIQNKVESYPWVTPNRYASLVCRQNMDLTLAPLVPSEIARNKSDLRYVEAAVCSAAFLGSDFEDSPYARCPDIAKVPLGYTMDQLDERLRQICDRETYNGIVEKNWEFLLKEGRIMESEQYVGRLMDAWCGESKAIAFDLI